MMASKKSAKISPDALRQAVSEIGREVSARTILMHQAIAEKVGVSLTELKCLDYVSRGTLVTAGQLAEITGLTTGAITAMVDRLERAGLVRRERSGDDRRKVFICPAQEAFGDFFQEIYGPLAQAAANLAAQYSEEQLELIYEYTLRSIQLVREQTERVRAMKVSKPRKK